MSRIMEIDLSVFNYGILSGLWEAYRLTGIAGEVDKS